MSKAGLTPMQILASLTTAPAARWDEADRRGRLEVGMDADIIVLDADPAEDAKNFARCVAYFAARSRCMRGRRNKPRQSSFTEAHADNRFASAHNGQRL